MTEHDKPIYKIGWIIPGQVVALTHYTPTVSMDDFQHINADAARLIEPVTGTFHVIIDNRIIEQTQPTPLAMMQQVAPHMRHAGLRWIVVIVPEKIKGTAADWPVEQSGNAQLKHVDSLEDAFSHLKESDPALDWDALDGDFFA